MKAVTLFLSLASFSTAYAGGSSYECAGRLQSGAPATFSFAISGDHATVEDEEGDEATLDREKRANEGSQKFAVFADRNWDGYGGYLKLSVPQAVAVARGTVAQVFTGYFTKATYSELGHISTLEITGKCAPSSASNNNSAKVASAAAQAAKLASLVPTAEWMSEAEYGWSAFSSAVPVSEDAWKQGRVSAALASGNSHIEIWSNKSVLATLNNLATDQNTDAPIRAEYAKLLKAFKKDFKDLRGFKVGKPDSGSLDLHIVGRNADGYLVGVKTITVET